jgi:hypothetical protein
MIFDDCFINVLTDNFFPNIGKNCFKFAVEFALKDTLSSAINMAS